VYFTLTASSDLDIHTECADVKQELCYGTFYLYGTQTQFKTRITTLTSNKKYEVRKIAMITENGFRRNL